VAGLRGTGSKTVRVQGAFVPAHRVQDAATNGPGRPRAARAASALYCQPVGGTLGLALAAVALGGAEGAFELFRQRMKQRVLRLRGEVQAADPAAQIELAATAVRVASARLLLHAACDQVRQAGEADGEPSAEALAELRVYKAHVVALCAEAINRLFASSGGGALQDANPLQRLWRDVHAVQAHASLTWSTQAQNYGSIAVGLGPTLRAWWQGSPARSSG